MRREIRALQRRLGMTMLYVTHDQIEAMTMADQVLLMRSGRIEQSGSPAELYARPATIFSARFIGTPPMNVVAARSVVAANGKFPLEAPNGANPDQLAVGVRPEDVRVDAEGVAARVVAVEFLGADTLVETRIADEPFMLRVAGRSTAAPGDVLGVAWAGGAAHWFDLSSGSRMT